MPDRSKDARPPKLAPDYDLPETVLLTAEELKAMEAGQAATPATPLAPSQSATEQKGRTRSPDA